MISAFCDSCQRSVDAKSTGRFFPQNRLSGDPVAKIQVLGECGHVFWSGRRVFEDMPIRPENRERYGEDWPAFSDYIRFTRASGRCECEGECGRGTHVGRCPNLHGYLAYGSNRATAVVLTVAHLCHTPECRECVRAMCQGCHLHYDKAHHAETARKSRDRAAGQSALFGEEPEFYCPKAKPRP